MCADRGVAVEAAELLLVEDLRDEAHVAEDRQPPAVRDGDPGRLLAAMLEREEPEVRDARDVALAASGCRRRRTSASSPRRSAEPARARARRRRSGAHAGSRRCPSGSRRAGRPRRARPLHSAASSSAASSPAAPTSCASVRSGAAFQRKRISAASACGSSGPAGTLASRTASPARQRPGIRRTSGTSADTADDRRRRDRAAVGLVVERDVARDDRDAERARRGRDPVDRLRELPGDLGFLGIAEVEAVGQAERLPAGAGDVSRRAEDGLRARVERRARRPASPGATRRGRAATAQPEHGGVEPRAAHRPRADEAGRTARRSTASTRTCRVAGSAAARSGRARCSTS